MISLLVLVLVQGDVIMYDQVVRWVGSLINLPSQPMTITHSASSDEYDIVEYQ